MNKKQINRKGMDNLVKIRDAKPDVFSISGWELSTIDRDSVEYTKGPYIAVVQKERVPPEGKSGRITDYKVFYLYVDHPTLFSPVLREGAITFNDAKDRLEELERPELDRLLSESGG